VLRPRRREQGTDRDAVPPRVIGRDPFDVEVVWEDLYNRIKDYGAQGFSITALSGIDIALWDVIGRAVNKPIHKLIGGAHRTEVQAYATGLYFIDMDRLVEEAVEEAEKYAALGFRAIKMKIGLGDPALDLRRVAAVRAAIGPEVKLAVDANHCFTVPQAIRLGREMEELDLLWFEEPISPEDHDGYVAVTRALDMAVAGGENDFTRWGFRDIIARKAMDIVQPDLCAAGGISECRKIAALASAHGVECVPHAWGSRSGWRRRCSSSPPCRTRRPACARSRRCWSSSRRPTRCATTWRRTPSCRTRASCACRTDRAWASRSIAPCSPSTRWPERCASPTSRPSRPPSRCRPAAAWRSASAAR
jgi:L-alanine-DL-glutamate epimerase-like enolase superfamily enzyme